jgi:hypothetical protein
VAVGHDARGKTEDRLAIHFDIVLAAADRLEAGGQWRCRLPGTIKASPPDPSLPSSVARIPPGTSLAATRHGAGAIAKEDTCFAVSPIDNAAQRFGADHEHIFGIAGDDVAARHA